MMSSDVYSDYIILLIGIVCISMARTPCDHNRGMKMVDVSYASIWPFYLYSDLIKSHDKRQHFRPHLFSSSGEVDPFDLRVLSEDLVEILSRNVIQFT